MIVVDTGSADRTREIARSFNVQLLEFAWRNDFAAARNFGLERATQSWILYIDADERLDVPAGRSILDGLSDRASSARVRFLPRSNVTASREYRVFRNDRRIRFQGAMHETIVPSLESLSRTDGLEVVNSPAEILHLGYEGDQTHKHIRNLPLLRQAVLDDPERLYYWQHLAQTLLELGRPAEAREVCRKGLEIARSPERRRDRRMGVRIAWVLARLLRDAGEDPLPTINEGLAYSPDDKAMIFLKARALVDHGQYKEALAIIDSLTAIDAATFVDPFVSYDVRIFGSHAHDLAGVAHLKLGDRASAAAAFARAASMEPDNPTYLRKAQALGWADQ
jgi:tetratricopeptide (TPR) repeat protein